MIAVANKMKYSGKMKICKGAWGDTGNPDKHVRTPAIVRLALLVAPGGCLQSPGQCFLLLVNFLFL